MKNEKVPERLEIKVKKGLSEEIVDVASWLGLLKQ